MELWWPVTQIWKDCLILLDTTLNDLSFAILIEAPWFHFKVLYNSALPTCLLFYFSTFFQTKSRICKLFSICFSQCALTASSIWPHLSSTHFLKQSDNPSHSSFWMTCELEKKGRRKCWPTHLVNRCMSICTDTYESWG